MMHMSEGILLELQFFGRAFLCGVSVTIIYDILRLFRKAVPHSTVAIAAEDLFYWIGCAILIFRMMYLENSGAIRGFAIAAVILGMLLYMQLMRLMNKLRKKLHKCWNGFIMFLKH